MRHLHPPLEGVAKAPTCIRLAYQRFAPLLPDPPPLPALPEAAEFATSTFSVRPSTTCPLTRCEMCGKELAAGAQRFCDEECRGVFMKGLKHGTRSAPRPNYRETAAQARALKSGAYRRAAR